MTYSSKIGTYLEDISLYQIENTQKSFKILDNSGTKVAAQFPISEITSIVKEGSSVLVYSSLEDLRFDFASSSVAGQVYSLMGWVKDDPTRTITDLGATSSREDLEAPVIYFNPIVKLNGVTGTWSSTYSGTFSATWVYTDILSKRDLAADLVRVATDNRDGILTLTESNIFIYTNSTYSNYISGVGAYVITFDLDDRAGNSVGQGLTISLTVTSS
jgi:hypothetical protein